MAEENTDLCLFLCEQWAIDSEITPSVKLDQLIAHLTDVVINTNSPNVGEKYKNLCKLLSLKMNLTTVELKQVAISSKLLVNHFISSTLACTHLELYEEGYQNICVFKTLEACLECLILAGEVKFCEQFINLLLKELPKEGDNFQHVRDKVVIFALECFLNVMRRDNVRANKCNYSNLVQILQGNHLNERVALLLLNTYEHVFTPYILLNVVSNFVHICQTNTVITAIWDNISLNDSNVTLSHRMHVLCTLADIYILTDSNNLPMLIADKYWQFIQSSLSSDNALLRKQGLHLLKRSIDAFIFLKINVELDIFSWKHISSEMLSSIWETYFILLEIVEEKQAHLVIPVIKSIFKPSESNVHIHPSWYLVVCSRLISHDSLQVVKMGILSFLKLDIRLYFNSTYKQTINILFVKLNNMLLFYCNSSNIEWSDLDLSLKDWFSDVLLTEIAIREELLSTILDGLVKVNWCTIPLFHILHSLSVLPPEELFNESDIILFSNFLNESIRTQNVFVRGAVQCAVLNIIGTKTKKNINLFPIANILGIFRQIECLQRGLITWKTAEKWVVKCLLQNDDAMEELVTKKINLPIKSKARCLILLFDCGLIDFDSRCEILLRKCFSSLKDTRFRPYSCTEESDKCIELIMHLLQESQYFQKETEMKDDGFIKLLIPFISEVIPYINKRLFEIDQLIQFDIVECYVDTLKTMIENSLVNSIELKELNNQAVKIALSSSSSLVQRYFGLKIIIVFLIFLKKEHNKEDCSNINNFCLSIIKSNQFSIKHMKDSNYEHLSRNHQALWGRLVSQYTHALWTIILQCLEAQFLFLKDIVDVINYNALISLALNSIDSGGRDSLISILGVAKYVFQTTLLDFELISLFLNVTWKCCFDMRKMSLFWPCITAWVKMAFNDYTIENSTLQPLLINFSEELMSKGETVSGITNILLSHLLKNIKCAFILKNSIFKALLFGPVLRRDQRIEHDTCSLIRTLGADYAVNQLIPESGSQSSYEVRICSLAILMTAHDSYRSDDEKLLVEAVHELIERDKILTAKRQRYHGDSLHHRIKHRTLQALLVLEAKLARSSSHLAKSVIEDLVAWSSFSLQGESQQPSVRYQLEWLLVRSLIHSAQVDSFWTIFSQASEERTGSVCSFISVAYHLAKSLQDPDFIDRCITEILPWCMAQHFNVRLYAQVALQKVLPLDANITSKYQVIYNSVMKSISQGNAVRNAEKLKSDFYFTAFHPMEHFSLETIFWELPRLSNITKDEWIPVPCIKQYFGDEDPTFKVTNTDCSLKQFSAATWVVKATADNEILAEANGLQKKFVPWKNMFSDESSRQSYSTELTVVASLIDKLPNLGGLARSCEVFAVQALVVPSLEYTQDKLFSTLSMTAEKHINIIEVKPHDLPLYLREKKQSGYTLVGAEQTAASVSLETYSFPRKCVLLLGNEKEGIPANLLPFLDVCVEVRQLGLVRSLNVHVTGALFIWEYTRQYLAVENTATSLN